MSFRLRWPPCTLVPKCAFHPYSTVFSARRRLIDAYALKQLRTTLLYVLRTHTGREYGFGNRADGYVSVKRLLNHPEFQSLDMERLQQIIFMDEKHRFDFEFDPTKGGDSFWIRAKKWNDTHWVLKPILLKDQPGTPVYSTTLKEWQNHVARIGIPRGKHDWIEISRTIPTKEYLLDLPNDVQQVFIFLNLSHCLDAGIRFFSPTPSTQKWTYKTPLITKGNEAGFIPPSLFSQVELVTAKTNLLWGDPKPIHQEGWVGFDELDFNPNGERKTYLQAGKGITGFVLPEAFTLMDTGLRVHDVPGLKDEAMAALETNP